MKVYFSIIAILIVLSLFLTYLLLQPSVQEKTVCINQSCFTVEIADTPQEHAHGLMFRESLPEKHGMLFIFETEEQHSFWMKNTHIPLDIMWIKSNNEIVYIATAEPCTTEICPTYTPNKPATYVLELNAGTTTNHNINVGDSITFNGI